MKRLSFQLRITLMTALLIAATCTMLNLLLYRSGSYHIDALGEYVVEYSDVGGDSGAGGIPDVDDAIVIDMTQEEFDRFYESFFSELAQTKSGFAANGWALTIAVTLAGSVIAYFVSGFSLKPLHDFSAQAEQIQAKNLTEIKLAEDTIPEFRALSRSINRMLERLSEAFDAQGQFAGNAAHELRTPLALMQARLDLWQRDPAAGGEGAAALLAEQVERMSDMVKTLLAMSELEEVPREGIVELGPLIEEVLADLEPLADSRDVELVQEGSPERVTGSDLLLYRLLFNLVENGIKYNVPGGRVAVSVAAEDDAATIRVADTGRGIPKEAQKSIFQPFYRVDKSRSRSMGGVGLGLALAWEVVRLHGGSLQVEESSESGTVFAVRLPSRL